MVKNFGFAPFLKLEVFEKLLNPYNKLKIIFQAFFVGLYLNLLKKQQ